MLFFFPLKTIMSAPMTSVAENFIQMDHGDFLSVGNKFALSIIVKI